MLNYVCHIIVCFAQRLQRKNNYCIFKQTAKIIYFELSLIHVNTVINEWLSNNSLVIFSIIELKYIKLKKNVIITIDFRQKYYDNGKF